MKRILTGRHQPVRLDGEEVQAFLPLPLPPRTPSLSITGPLEGRLRAAEQALARLAFVAEGFPALHWLPGACLRKEAVLSSQIQGTQATLADLLAFEAEKGAAPGAEIQEIRHCIGALKRARAGLGNAGGQPPSLQLLHETHRLLMREARGQTLPPGELRRDPVWIGGSRPGHAVHVPPPAPALPKLLEELDTYLRTDRTLPPLVRAGLAQVQFGSLHPYPDGNGRIGRILVLLLLEHWGLLKAPLLFPSLFLKRNRDEYYRRMNNVRAEGDWEGWLDFFLDGIATVAEETVATACELSARISADRGRVLERGTASLSALRLFELLPEHPIVNVAAAMKRLGTSKPTAIRAIQVLVDAGVLVETTGRRRGRSFAYQAWIDRLQEGTELDRR